MSLLRWKRWILATRLTGWQPAPLALLLLVLPLQSIGAPINSIIDLQVEKESTTIRYKDSRGRSHVIDVVNPNPRVNVWYVVEHSIGKRTTTYHLQNPDPERLTLALEEGFPTGLLLSRAGVIRECELWGPHGQGPIAKARKGGRPFAPLCEGQVYLRNKTKGRQTSLEKVTDFLRDNVWGGEKVIGLVKETVMKDAFLEQADTEKTDGAQGRAASLTGPASAQLAPAYADAVVRPKTLGIEAEGVEDGYQLGRWYSAKHAKGVFVSVMKPGTIAKSVVEAGQKRAKKLDKIEAKALAYLVAFDLSQLDMGFALGTQHPRVDWSPRVPGRSRKGGYRSGPDGIGSSKPLTRTGLVPPGSAGRAVATFTGGFKRRHGGFKYGELAKVNRGSHYGFIEEGILFSQLRPDLATLLVRNNGNVEMKTWKEGESIADIRYARQNGVPIVERDPQLGVSIPGALVGRWGPGNWSGSSEGKLRTLRAGLCLQDSGPQSFLLYGYFSSATPSAMARVFQSYGCGYGMKLDMNALEHTYLAVYHQQDDALKVEHLVDGMKVLDRASKGKVLPRFLGVPDNRDFFYLMHRGT